MTTLSTELLTSKEMEIIHDRSLYILETAGATVSHKKALTMLNDAGAIVDPRSQNVLFPKKLVEKCIQLTPKRLTLAAYDQKYDITLPHPQGSFYTRSGTGAKGYIDLELGHYRSVKLSDTKDWVCAVDALEHIDMCAVPSPEDAPEKTKSIYALRCAMQNTKKHIMIQPYNKESLEYITQMALLLSDGKANLKKRPLISIVASVFAPLTFGYTNVEAMFLSSQYGIPIQLGSLVNPGGTVPITIAGSVLLSNAQLLAGVAISQVIQPGLPIVLVTQNIPINMIVGNPLAATVEAALANAAGVQLVKDLYHIPVSTTSLTSDAIFPDCQSMIERTFMSLLIALAKADILRGAGQVETANAISLIQLAIDNDLIGILQRLVKGILVDDESLAAEIIIKVGPGGNFLTEDHTLRHCREAYNPSTFNQNGRSAMISRGGKNIIEKAKDRIISILGQEKTPHLTEELLKELDQIVKKADMIIA